MIPLRFLLALLLPGWFSVVALAQGGPSYSKQIQPFFTRYCVECHNAKEPEGDLNLESHKALMEGGLHGPVLQPGKPDTSRLVRMIEGKGKPVMPPKGSRQPTKEEIAQVRAWVLAGALSDGVVTRVQLPKLAAKRTLAPAITALAYSADGKWLAVSGRGEVLLLDAVTGEIKARLPAGRDRVTAIAFAAKTGTLAVASSTAGEGHEVRIWRGKLEGPGTVVLRHDDVIQSLAFHPAGTLLASASYDRLIRFYDLTTNRETLVLRDHSDAVYDIAFNPDGTLLVSGAADRAVKVWDVRTGARLYTLSEPTDWVYAVAWSPDGKHLVAGGVDRSIRVWEVDHSGGKIAHSVFAHEGPVNRLAYSRDGKTLYSLCEDGGSKSWETARMTERKVYPAQPEAPLSLALRTDEKQLAIGRYDGALVLLDPATGKTVAQPLPVKPRPPVLEKIAPAAGVRGRAVEVVLQGKMLAGATLIADVPGVSDTRVSESDTEVRVRLQIPANTAPGAYKLRLKTAGGESAAQTFHIDRSPAVLEREPNGSPKTGTLVTLPATVVGSIDREGECDWFRFDAKKGQEVGAQAFTATIGSKLLPVLRLVDPSGDTVAESVTGVLGHVCAREGTYSLGVRHRDYAGGANMGYRVAIGDIPVVTSVFPLGLQRGTTAEIRVEGVHLGKTRTVSVSAPATAALGSRLPVPVNTADGPALGGPTVVVGEFPEIVGTAKATLSAPVTANGLLAQPGAAQTWRFRARKGERVIVEVEADRIGSPVDSMLEILDASGKPLPRAVLRSVARTFSVFRDHDSRGTGIRIETWSELLVNDYILVGSELLRIRALPRNPDDDCQFFSEVGRRAGYLGTTPTHVSQGTTMYKVAIHPPGSTFPPNGMPLTTMYWRNDDGGGRLGKDSRLAFDAPADGEYVARVSDSRGEGGKDHAYRLILRTPRPDFQVTFSVAGSVNRGGAVPVRVNLERLDEFEGLVDVKLLETPKGFEAPATNIPPLDNATAFSLFADAKAADAKAKLPPMVLEARATIDGKEVKRQATGTWPKVAEPGTVTTTTKQREVSIKPGGEARVTVAIERSKGYDKRVPIEVQGLPHGVRVLDVGLNGILITPGETTRTFVLYAEPWVRPMSHPIVVLSRIEGKGTEHAARSVLLRVE